MAAVQQVHGKQQIRDKEYWVNTMNPLFTDEDQKKINAAIQKAESQTSAEILPVVAHASGRYDRPEDVVGLWFAGLAIIGVWYLFPDVSQEAGNWSTPSPAWELVAILIAGVLGFIIGAIIASKTFWLRRIFTPKAEMNDEVLARARQVFFDERIHHTEKSTGVLLYVSMYEKMAAIIADKSIIEKLGQDQIDLACAEFTSRLHSGDMIDAFCVTAVELGEKLSPLFPRSEDDVNELADALVVIN